MGQLKQTKKPTLSFQLQMEKHCGTAISGIDGSQEQLQN